MIFLSPVRSQPNPVPPSKTVFVDEKGILRWTQNKEEIKGFGVNYTVPFAHAYRSAQKLGVDVYEAMDRDIRHFQRLGFDLYRIHVWDTEISDSLGNLIENEHLRAFDYLIHTLSQQNIRYILTPIAFWGNGWPEPDEPTPGFAHKYGKAACLTDKNAILAQENYLQQFLNRTNTYSGETYMNDPALIAVEISNEPHHRGTPEEVKEYVSRMIRAVKSTGFQNPVLYNFSHGIQYVEQYIAAGAEGGTFQWYPTGLGHQKELKGNFTPNVDEYRIPFDSIMRAHGMARTVYEFDAADLNKSYLYPIMARSFRSAGIQLATYFSYDPTFLAPFNTEYNTHYMNLVYTPHKALALMISSRVFHEVPVGEHYGDYPENQDFGNFSVDPERDLALYNGKNSFIYTHHTDIAAQDPDGLSLIAGHGNSPVVQYEGTGAYFLEEREPGIWQLEVMPDVLIISDPFGRNSLERTLAVLQHNERKMNIDLPRLGKTFHIMSLDEPAKESIITEDGSFPVKPGIYRLFTPEKKKRIAQGTENADQKPLIVPASTVTNTFLVHESPGTHAAGIPLPLAVELISPETIESVTVYFRMGYRGALFPMSRQSGFSWEASIPAEQLSAGPASYYLVVQTPSGQTAYPGAIPGNPYNWDFRWDNPYELSILSPESPYVLFDPAEDLPSLRYQYWPDRIFREPLDNRGSYALHLELDQLHRIDPENPDGPVIERYTLDYFPDVLFQSDSFLLKNKTRIVAEISGTGEKAWLQLALVDKQGKAFGKSIRLDGKTSNHSIDLADLDPVPTVIMPRPYPTFLPYYFSHRMDHPLKLSEIQRLQLSLHTDGDKNASGKGYSLRLGRIWLE
jgi:hypothetical protein